MNTNQRKALELFTIATRGYLNVDGLAGPSNASLRATILSTALGVKVPKTKAGITELRKTLYQIRSPDLSGDCLAVQDRKFTEFVVEALNLRSRWTVYNDLGQAVATTIGGKPSVAAGHYVRFDGPEALVKQEALRG